MGYFAVLLSLAVELHSAVLLEHGSGETSETNLNDFVEASSDADLRS
jgi:hypothetical protein